MEEAKKKRNRETQEKTSQTTQIVIKDKKEVEVKKSHVETCSYIEELQNEPSCDFFGSD